ncbi:prolyl-tRNA synthetase [Candidatus Gracilibacteria bacterium]|nr:prolyl-tRNA synthetase [Candidatus Gracilibacteria bacterium]MCF7898824.1 prolyl-tRNA synthetase [Candidatus Paceibacterota bacterium]
MRQSKLYTKTRKDAPKDEVSTNAILLTRAGYIHKEMAGVYTMLPLGLRVLTKIENIIRRHMDEIGNELLMTALSPKETWEKTGRLETIDVLMKTMPANKVSEDKSSASYVLGSTHEEMITPIAQEYSRSYKDLPSAFYQIQTKFRNEARAKSGLLRGREFRMKDLYSFHKNADDLNVYYDEAKKVYMNIFNEVGIGADTFITLAGGGDFTKDFSHEFQTLCDAGEDTIFLDRKNNIAYNKEVTDEATAKKLGVDFTKMEQVRACEIGNIFPLNTKFSKAFDYTYVDETGTKQDVYMGCYGIGPTRLMGVVVEKFADEKGLIWPESIAPFSVHLIVLSRDKDGEAYKVAEKIYEAFNKSHVEVLFDDREASAGEKFADSDLIGIPMRVVVSDKSLEKGGVELKERKVDASEIITVDQLLQMYTRPCC